jgi:uncharacterized protein (DUF302 family)
VVTCFSAPAYEDVMAHYFNKTLPVGFEEAVRRTMEALKQEGFGIITEIDVQDDRRHD